MNKLSYFNPLIVAGSSILSLSFILPSHAAILVTGFSQSQENAAVSGHIIEDFEDTELIDGLTINFRGGVAPQSYTGNINRTFDPSQASGIGILGGPFTNNTWDGQKSLTNGGHGDGITGESLGDGNFWDFAFADITEFSFSSPLKSFGVGLSNFQSSQFSASNPFPITDHELFINGELWGFVESIPGWQAGTNVANLYVFIEATEDDLIHSVAFRNADRGNADVGDGLVFDKLAVKSVPEPRTILGTLSVLGVSIAIKRKGIG